MHIHLCVLAPMEGRLRRSVPNLPVINPDRLKTAKALVEKAVKLQKVFSVQGPYPVIRSALWARGWVERRLPLSVQRAPHWHGDEEDDGDDGDVSTDDLADMYDLMSRLVRNETSYFYWTTRRDSIDCRSLQRDQMTNHFANAASFTTKVGLCVNLRNLHWFDAADPDTFFPRCYRLGAEDEKQAFIEDYRRTACTSLLQYVVETSRWRRNRGEGVEEKSKVVSVESEGNTLKYSSECAVHRLVGPGMIDRALHVCQEFLNMLEHSDIDVTMATPPVLTEQQWDEFLQDYYLVVHEGASIKGSSVFVERCQAMLTRLQEVCPQLDTDGLQNIWIIKPGAKSRGRGIMCMNQLDEILVLVDSDSTLIKDSKWVVQKYLERPLLVHGTKFDLRQWFLVTDWNPLTIWFYKECYLRFSTQPYSTKTLDSSVHLCNNSIQKHFQPSHNRHPELPDDNMWSCSQFRAFLREQGRGPEWGTVVVPGMQQAVIHALQTAQDLVEGRKASFELYGADFMLGRDLRPWLLEINASPTMACSTAVTARLCPAVQLDTLRVVLDWRTDHQAYTGGFQLIYKQAAVEVPQYVGMNLLVEGAPIRRTRPPPHRHPEAEMTDKLSGHKLYPASAYCHSGKENQSVGDKKRQLPSASPKRQHEGRTTGQSISSSRRGAPLVPRTLSYSLNPPCSISDSKPHPNPVLRSQSSRPCPPRAATEPQCRALNTGLPSLHGLLPALEVFSLRPNIVAGGLTQYIHQTYIVILFYSIVTAF
uniref:Tubulin tyrosine ligase-like family, member 3 n=1 Tax=Myripristis murdjan TaxID=586833 RepID=A0A668AE69_9TELE